MSRGQRAFRAAPADGGFELVDPIADGRWEAFLAQAPGANAFHHPAWLSLLTRSYGYPIRACCLVDSTGAIRAGLPLALVGGGLRRPRLASLPFSDECAPLTAPADDAALAAELVAALDTLRRALGLALEVRGPVAPTTSVQVVDRYHQHEIALERDFDAVVARFRRRSQLMRGVRRAEREGLTVERRTDTGALADFYRLHLATRHRQGVPTQPRSFILRFAELFERDLGFVLVVRDGEQAIAAAVFLAFNGTLIYKYGASDASALGKRPNNLLFLEAIRWGCEAGMHTLDMGRTDIGHESLREFKLSWGAEERTLEYHQLADGHREAAQGMGLAHKVAPLIRRSPPVVGRLVGAALYRYAG
ncbi:MAG TPA: GNAT family N-acetyltransferase [Solirubrobacteraceae bacterium]